MSRIQFYEERYNRYLRKLSHEYKSFFRKSDRSNFNEGNHSYGIKKPNQLYFLIRIIAVFLVCVWFYIDIVVDLFLCYYYASKLKWPHMSLTMLFVVVPILVSTANETYFLIPSKRQLFSKIIAYRSTQKTPCETLLIFLKKIFLLDILIKLAYLFKFSNPKANS